MDSKKREEEDVFDRGDGGVAVRVRVSTATAKGRTKRGAVVVLLEDVEGLNKQVIQIIKPISWRLTVRSTNQLRGTQQAGNKKRTKPISWRLVWPAFFFWFFAGV